MLCFHSRLELVFKFTMIFVLNQFELFC